MPVKNAKMYCAGPDQTATEEAARETDQGHLTGILQIQAPKFYLRTKSGVKSLDDLP